MQKLVEYILFLICNNHFILTEIETMVTVYKFIFFINTLKIYVKYFQQLHFLDSFLNILLCNKHMYIK